MSGPLLILGAGPRCGSTLLQRLISSHPDGFIWGEQEGYLFKVLDAVERLHDHDERHGGVCRQEFAARGHQGFMANLMPEPAVVANAFEAFFTLLFRAPEARVWGFKEVRYDLGFVRRLQRFVPDVRVIFLVRDPREVLCSLDEWERAGWWPRTRSWQATRHWQQIAASFLQPTSIPLLSLRYENFIADPDGSVRLIGDFTGLGPAGFDMSVFDRKVHNIGAEGEHELRSWDELPASLRVLLAGEEFRTTAEAYGYVLDNVPEPTAEPAG